MNIHVRWGYRVSAGQHIEKGIYPPEHPGLYGLTDMLVTNGHALLTEQDATVGMDERPPKGTPAEGTISPVPELVAPEETEQKPVEPPAFTPPLIGGQPPVEAGTGEQVPPAEPSAKSITVDWLKADLLAFADTWKIEGVISSARRDDIAAKVDAWIEATQFNPVDLAVWYQDRHKAD